MSDHSIILIPANPGFAPTEQSRDQGKSVLSGMAPAAEEIRDELSEAVRFHDCGANHETTSCPSCQATLEEEWWGECMSHNFDEESESFKLESVSLPCCGAMHSLNDLAYSWQQGFARYSLEALNPGIESVADEGKAKLERAVGCQLKVIYQHL